MDPDIQKAQEYVSQAEKLGRSGFFSSLIRGSDNNQERISLLEKAANCYKIAKTWREAGKVFVKAAELCTQQKAKHDAAVNYVNAAVAFKKEDPSEAINCLTKAIEVYTDMNRPTMVAKYHFSIAEIFEQLGNPDQAIRHYLQAADFYHMEDSVSSAMNCKLNLARLYVQLQQYDKGAEIYDEVGRACMENKLLKYSARDHLFRSILCKLNLDVVNGKNTLADYKNTFPMFDDSRECKLLEAICNALHGKDVNAFTTAVKEYDSISRLDTVPVSMLLQLKKTISEDEDEDIT